MSFDLAPMAPSEAGPEPFTLGAMTRMTDDQQELLRQIVDDYGTVKEEFYYSTAGGGTTLQQPGVEGGKDVHFPDLEQLAARGFVSMTPQEGLAMTGSLYPTGDGVHEVAERRRVDAVVRAGDAISPDSGTGIGWADNLPVLEAVVELYRDVAPGQGVSQSQVNGRLGREESDVATSRQFELLADAGYVKSLLETDQIPGPLTVAPSERALQLLAGWPADGAVALERLIAVLQDRIDATTDPDEKGRLRNLLSAIQGIGQELAAAVLVKVIMGG